MKRAIGVTLVAIALWASWLGPSEPVVAAQERGSDITAARAHYSRGLDLHSAGRYAEARAELEQAYAAAPTFRLLYDLALACDGQGDRSAAIRYAQRYLAESGPGEDPAKRRQTEDLLVRLRERVALVSIRTNVGGNAAVTVDEQPYGSVVADPLVLLPGTRKIWVTQPGFYPASRVVLLKEGDAVDLTFELKPLPRSSPEHLRWWENRLVLPGALLGVAIVAVAVLLRMKRGPRGVSVPHLNPYRSEQEPGANFPTPAQTNVIAVDELVDVVDGPVSLDAAVATDIGRVKPSNEDRHLLDVERRLFVVADGIGGFAGGAVASATAVQTIEDGAENDVARDQLNHLPPDAARLTSAVFAANAAIRRKQLEMPDYGDMGTTCVAAQVASRSSELCIVHIGDSRAYRLRGGSLVQLTTDHTMAELGVTGRRAGHLSRALGSEPSPRLDVLLLRAEPDDMYLLCCDGITKMLADVVLRDVLEATSSAADAAASLVARANEAGGLDNLTALVFRVSRRA